MKLPNLFSFNLALCHVCGIRNTQEGTQRFTYIYIHTCILEKACIDNSLSLSHDSYLDGTVTCTIGTKTAAATARGGISKVSLELVTSGNAAITDASTAAVRTTTAANGNVGVHRIKLWTKAANVESLVSSSDYTLTGEKVEFVTTAVKGGGTASAVLPATQTCDFSSGVCGTGTNLAGAALLLNLTKSGTSGSNDVQVKIRGIASNNISMIIDPSTATSMSIAPVALQTAGTTFSVTISGFDTFLNPSMRGCTGITSWTGGSTSPSGTAASYSLGAFTNTTDVTFPNLQVTLPAVGTQTLTFTPACTPALATNPSVTVAVKEGSIDNIKLLALSGRTGSQVNTDSAVSAIACRHTATSGNEIGRAHV